MYMFSTLAVGASLILPLLSTTVAAFNPDRIGVIQENTFQVEHSQRLIYFFVIIGIVAGAGIVFMFIIFGCDALEKARTRQVDTEKYLSRIEKFEDDKAGEVEPGENVFDFHYFPSSTRPDHVVTDEMASVTDATIERIRRQAIQRRKFEHATRFVAQTARTQIKLNSGLSFLSPAQGALDDAKGKTSAAAASSTGAGGAVGRTSSGSHGRVGTPLHSQVAAGLTNSGHSQQNIQGTNPFSSALGERTLEDPDYFGFEDDLDFELQ